jgi:predicted O-linked N-acetylglucosamine transferase (SPINDLY family)
MSTAGKKTPLKVTVERLLEQGLAIHRAGDVERADDIYRQVLRRSPHIAVAWYLRSVVAMGQKRHLDASVFLENAVRHDPKNVRFLCNLGEAYRRLGRLGEAVIALRRATTDDPTLAEAHFNLGVVLKELGSTSEAHASLERAMALKPELPGLETNLRIVVGGLRREQFEMDEAVQLLEQAVELDPTMAAARNGLGLALADRGQLDEAIQCFRKALELDPDDHTSRGNLLFALPYHPDFDAATIRSEAETFARLHANQPSRGSKHRNTADPEKRLRVGYVSPDFREHVTNFFVLPLLRNHDRSRVEIYCYADVRNRDEMTETFRAERVEWRDISQMDDQGAAARIEEDGIDVLLDLAMHSSYNRILMLAKKPAPVQACYLAYLGTTGLQAMDFRLTEPRLDPEGEGELTYTETCIHLPDGYWCYDPLTDVPSVTPLPALKNGYVTFGSMNAFRKVNVAVLERWSAVLQAVPGARMIVHAPPGFAVSWVRETLSRLGTDPTRLDFVSRLSRNEYLDTYDRIDVCLDTLPYNGGTTTLDAHWMGVPVVTEIGRTVFGRAGYAIAHQLSLLDLVANNREEYVACAVSLVKDLERLASLRATLRDRLARSPLMDAPRFARNIEQAYRRMWTQWCRAQ